jgi:UDP-N-acetylmuramate dehydrogenase
LLYPDLKQRFVESTQPPKIFEVRDAVLDIRRAKSMVLSENDPDSKSAGSFFKNPVLDQKSYSILEGSARAAGLLKDSESIPCFQTGPTQKKVPAAWLIEHAGFFKGYVHKNAGISGKHALALINRGGATAQDILELMRLIQDRVQKAFGVELQPEPIFAGFGKAGDRRQKTEDSL